MHTSEAKERAIGLYDSGLSARAAARKFQQESGTYVSSQTIARWMREVGRSRQNGPQRFIELPRSAKRLYESGMNIEQVAERFRVSKTCAAKRLREMGAEIRPSGSLFGPALTADRLRQMDDREGLRAQEIAKAVGCDTGTLYNWLRKRSIPLKRKGLSSMHRAP